MRVLAIDCATDWLSVAACDGSASHERRERAVQWHAERALPIVDAVLAECGWRLEDLDGIAFGAGPGSFTGVRIACGIAQGLALGAGLPVVPVATLQAIAQDARRYHGAQRVLACLDARMHEVYVAAYERVAEAWREVAAPAVLKPGDVVTPPGRWFGAGQGLSAYPALVAQLELAGHDADLVPSARAIAELAVPRLAAGEGVAPEQALPLYVRHRVALTTAERGAGAKL